MVKSRYFISLSAALILCGSLSSLNAFGSVEVNGGVNGSGSVDVEHGGSVEVDHSGGHVGGDWVDKDHNHYFGADFRYDEDAKVARWPYVHHDHVSPAYVDEDYADWHDVHKVHGHAVAIQFNPEKSGDITVDHFWLKDHNGHKVEVELASDNLSDREYAIVPKHRLDWDSEYSVDFAYHEDGTPRSEHWTYRTEKLDHPIYRIDDHTHTHYVAKSSTYAFYTGESDTDVEVGFNHNGDFRVEKNVDHDTFYVGVNADVGTNIDATVNGEHHKFHVFTNEIEDVRFTHVGDKSVTVEWDHLRSGEERGYKVYRDGKYVARVSADKHTYVDHSVKPGVTYRYTVKVTNDS